MNSTLKSLCEDAGLDEALSQSLYNIGEPFQQRPFFAATPSFKRFSSDYYLPCSSVDRFPSFSITGGACALNCKHCRAGVLKPMIATGTPQAFESLLRMKIAKGLKGFLLSGGSNKRNEVPFEPYLPLVKRLKAEFPFLEVLLHTGLVDARRAALIKDAGIDSAMMDVIGADQTIHEVYHLHRPFADFAASLKALADAQVNVVPHIVVGLHFGRLLGENYALEMIRAVKTQSAIIVVLMPHLADASFQPVAPHEVAQFFGRARQVLADRAVILGCARPAHLRQQLDAYAMLAGFDGIAFPADEAAKIAIALGRDAKQHHACCGLQRCKAA